VSGYPPEVVTRMEKNGLKCCKMHHNGKLGTKSHNVWAKPELEAVSAVTLYLERAK